DESGEYRITSREGEPLARVLALGPGLREAALVIGGLALFLYAMHEISRTLRRACGGVFRQVLGKFASSRLLGASAGALLSVSMQSSTGATVMAVGMAAAGLLTLAQAMPVIIGASVGTIVTIHVIAFDLANYALFIAAFGVVVTLAARYRLWAYAGRTIFGFGLIFFGMGLMREGMAPLEHSRLAVGVIESVTGGAAQAFAVSAVFTALVQSSAATVALAMTVAGSGHMSASGLVGVMLGTHIGTTIAPFVSGIGVGRTGLRVAFASFLYKAVAAVVLLPLAGVLATAAERLHFDVTEPRGIANVFTLVTLAGALPFAPFSRLYAKAAEVLIRERRGDVSRKRLNPALTAEPYAAASAVMLEAADIAALLWESAASITPALFEFSSVELERLENRDEVVDAKHRAAIEFLREAAAGEITARETRKISAVLYILRDLEAMGDLISKDIVPIGYRRLNADKSFGMGDMASIRRFSGGLVSALGAIERGLRLAAVSGLPVADGDVSRRLAEFQERAAGVAGAVNEAQAAHFSALARGVPEAVAADSVFVDAVAAFRQLYSLASDIAGILLNPPETTGFFHPAEKRREPWAK
ncbi:MAG TPA: Na/Pi cotransporter family protein, partial [Planctomycetes bacterium]|nr:Na/Pi cotransporter family protein [Planctomycetota bacterium]